MAELKTRISLKYDTLVNWQKSTLVLNKGELAIAVIPTADPDNKQLPPVMFKVGDGEHTFAQLGDNWASALAADVYGWAKAKTKPSYTPAEVGADVAGAAATAEANAKAYVDEQIGSIPHAAEYTLETGATDGSLVLKKDGVAVGDPAVVKGWAELLTKAQKGIDDAAAALAAAQAAQTTANGKYSKPANGIPKTDLADAVQTSLDKADTALQSHQEVALASGTKNGTLKLTVGGTATDNIAVTGLGSAAYKESTAFDAAGEAAKVLGESTDAATKDTVYGAKAAAKAAQDTIDAYKTSNDEALAAVKKTADAAQTSAQVDAKISTHNTSSAAHADIRGEITALAEKVSGRATNYVYKNKSDAAYTAAIGKAGSFIIGDTIYFTDANISDQWVIKVNAAAPYYEFQDIETEKPSFDGYVKGTGLTADKLVLGNAGSNVKTSTYGVSGTLTATDNANLPTSKAVADYVDGQLGNLDAAEVTATAAQTISSIKQVDGKITIGAAQDIQIAQSQVTGLSTALDGKQDNLSADQLAAVNSGITKTKVGTYDGYATGKQDALSDDQLAAVNSGITTAKVGQYDGYETSKQDKIDADHKISADFVSGLGAAAKKGVASSVTAAGVDLPTAAAVASYVGAEIDKISIPTVNNAALKDASGATIFTANASEDVQILVIDCGNASGWEA